MDTALRQRNVQVTLLSEDHNSEQTFSFHPSLLASLNQQLRTSLTSVSSESEKNWPERISNVLLNSVSHVVSNSSDINLFQQCFQELAGFYCSLDIPAPLRQRQFINNNGLVMSPDYAIRTVLDSARVGTFWQALSSILPQYAERECHLVYPACGPFAPLLLPVLHYLREQQLLPENLQVTLIDIHPAAIQSLAALVESLQLQEMVKVLHQDACDYQAENGSVDILLVEAMQHGLSREGHLNICQHFAPLLAEDALLLPEKISIRAVLTQADDEFPAKPREAGERNTQRVDIGPVLELSRESLRQLDLVRLNDGSELIRCQQVQVPADLNTTIEHILLLTTEMQVYQDLSVTEYASGITHPLPDLSVCIGFEPHNPQPGDLLIKPGDSILFYYRKQGLPGFLPVYVEPA